MRSEGFTAVEKAHKNLLDRIMVGNGENRSLESSAAHDSLVEPNNAQNGSLGVHCGFKFKLDHKSDNTQKGSLSVRRAHLSSSSPHRVRE